MTLGLRSILPDTGRDQEQSAIALALLALPPGVRRTLELSCEAPIWPGFVSFNSLFGRAVAPREPRMTAREEHGHAACDLDRLDAEASGRAHLTAMSCRWPLNEPVG